MYSVQEIENVQTDKCTRCQGLVVATNYIDMCSGMFYFSGNRCINCGFVEFAVPGTSKISSKKRRCKSHADIRIQM
jgi:hypothetical protein